MDNNKSPTASQQNEEDDDAWLYGTTQKEENQEENTKSDQINEKEIDETSRSKENDDTLFHDQEASQENGENETQKENGKENESDSESDDEDDINVVIGEIVKKPSSPTRQTSKSGPLATSNTIIAPNKPATVAKGVDVEGQGMIDDMPTYDFDLSSLRDEDKPWRKPGADITDYFNYGFNEETWIAYCLKQKKLRAENLGTKMIINPAAILGQPTMMQSQINPSLIQQQQQQQGLIQPPTLNPALMRPQFPRPMLPMIRKPGLIDVIGTTETNTRRPLNEIESMNGLSVIGNSAQQSFVPSQVDLGAPPPGYVQRMPPPSHQQRMPINYQPFPNPYMQQTSGATYPPQFNRNPNTMPLTRYQDSPRSRSHSPNTPAKAHSRSKSPNSDRKEKEDRRYRDERRRSRSRHRDRDHRTHRDYDRDRRDRKSSRSRDRSRSRSRDDKYKRGSRRRSGSDDDYRSSKSHKRSHKKSRRNRDSHDRDSKERKNENQPDVKNESSPKNANDQQAQK